MRVYADLHLHSCLSPCGDEAMTPGNIAGMAAIKGLQLIAVTDHNTARQLPSVKAACDRMGVALVPGLELCSREEVHLLAYFRSVEAAVEFSDAIYPLLPDIRNRPEFFGRQIIMDADDLVIGEEPRLLLSALDIGLHDLTGLVRAHGGLSVPAHINRGSNGILCALGFLPADGDYAALEIVPELPYKGDYSAFKILRSSDAHRLEDMLERVSALELSEPSADGFFAYLTAHEARA